MKFWSLYHHLVIDKNFFSKIAMGIEGDFFLFFCALSFSCLFLTCGKLLFTVYLNNAQYLVLPPHLAEEFDQHFWKRGSGHFQVKVPGEEISEEKRSRRTFSSPRIYSYGVSTNEANKKAIKGAIKPVPASDPALTIYRPAGLPGEVCQAIAEDVAAGK